MGVNVRVCRPILVHQCSLLPAVTLGDLTRTMPTIVRAIERIPLANGGDYLLILTPLFEEIFCKRDLHRSHVLVDVAAICATSG